MVGWLVVAFGVFVVYPQWARDLGCADSGQAEWSAFGPSCVHGDTEARMVAWPVAVAALALSAPVLVLWYRHPKPKRITALRPAPA
jgi:hypothetical protein